MRNEFAIHPSRARNGERSVADREDVTRAAAEKWVGRTIWQVHQSGTPVSYDVIGVAKRFGVPAGWPDRFCLHVLQDESLPQELRWNSSSPSFLSEETALEYTLSPAGRARLDRIERIAFARRGFGGSLPGLRPQREPIEVDLFTFAAQELSLRTGRPVSQERARLFYENASGNEAESVFLWEQNAP
jgi:hypothetical protein